MGVGGFLVHISVDVTHRILYYLGIKKVDGIAGDFVGEFNQWYHAVKTLYKCFASFPNYKYIINETYPVNN